ncbi:MAG: hypothetical protein ABIO72_03160 [Patescibacteria group bacterium]
MRRRDFLSLPAAMLGLATDPAVAANAVTRVDETKHRTALERTLQRLEDERPTIRTELREALQTRNSEQLRDVALAAGQSYIATLGSRATDVHEAFRTRYAAPVEELADPGLPGWEGALEELEIGRGRTLVSVPARIPAAQLTTEFDQGSLAPRVAEVEPIIGLLHDLEALQAKAMAVLADRLLSREPLSAAAQTGAEKRSRDPTDLSTQPHTSPGGEEDIMTTREADQAEGEADAGRRVEAMETSVPSRLNPPATAAGPGDQPPDDAASPMESSASRRLAFRQDLFDQVVAALTPAPATDLVNKAYQRLTRQYEFVPRRVLSASEYPILPKAQDLETINEIVRRYRRLYHG